MGASLPVKLANVWMKPFEALLQNQSLVKISLELTKTGIAQNATGA